MAPSTDMAPIASDLLDQIEQMLEQEHRALINAEPETLQRVSRNKLQALMQLDAAMASASRKPTVSGGATPLYARLRRAMVANARNQALLSILRSRVDERMQALGLLDSMYGRDGNRRPRAVPGRLQAAL